MYESMWAVREKRERRLAREKALQNSFIRIPQFARGDRVTWNTGSVEFPHPHTGTVLYVEYRSNKELRASCQYHDYLDVQVEADEKWRAIYHPDRLTLLP